MTYSKPTKPADPSVARFGDKLDEYTSKLISLLETVKEQITMDLIGNGCDPKKISIHTCFNTVAWYYAGSRGHVARIKWSIENNEFKIEHY